MHRAKPCTFTKWKQFDPEDGNNIAAFEYPANRLLTLVSNWIFNN
jgi:hypothetical protein